MDPRHYASHRHSHLILILLSALVGAVVMALILAQTNRPGTLPAAEAQQPQGMVSFEDVAQRVLPAVVYISSNLPPRVDPRWEEFQRQLEEMFRGMPGFPPGGRLMPPQARPRPAAGSGWIYSSDGYIVTNAHVVRGATKITVQLHDRENDTKEYPAKIVGLDPRTELAVIKIDAGRSLPTLTLGDSDKARIGAWVMAVGSPFQLQQTVTVGVISARGRTIEAESEYFQLGDLIQTDAPINPGNSGGPLVNLKGEVIGINVAIASPGTPVPVNIGIGFAIPSNVAKRVVPQLIEKGKVARGWMGVTIKNLNENLREHFGVKEGGVLITQVNENAPASNVLQPNDVVIAVDGKPVYTSAELQAEIANRPPGAKVTLDIVRDKKPQKVTVTLGEMPARYAGLEEEEAGAQADETAAGPPLQVRNITPQLAKQYNLTRPQGVFIEQVGGDLEEDGRLQVGDVILQVDDKPVSSVEEYRKAVREAIAAKRKFVVLTVERRGPGGQPMRDVVDVPLTKE